MHSSFPTQSETMDTPEVERISRLIDALRDYAITSAHEQWERHRTDAYRAAGMAGWDAFTWFELAHDWEMADFLLSDSWQACRLRRWLQSLLQWHGQNELDEIIARTKVLSIIN